MEERYHSPTGGVLIPSLQAIVTGLILGLAAWSLAVLSGNHLPEILGLAVGACGAAVCWIALLRRWLAGLDAILGIEPELVAEPEPQAVRVIVTDQERRSGQIADLPVAENKLIELGAGLLEGIPIAESYWTGSQGPFTVREFRQLRDLMIERGWLTWRNPVARAQGVTVTAQGRAVLRYFAIEFSPTVGLVERHDSAQ